MVMMKILQASSPCKNLISSQWTKAAAVFILLSISILCISWLAFFSEEPRFEIPNYNKRSTAGAQPRETNVSHIFFNLGGSVQTWHRRKDYSELWWQHGVTHGYVWLEKEPLQPWPQTCPPYKVSKSDVSKFGSRAAASRMAMIVAESFNLAVEEDLDIHWFVLGDDDTVFFVDNLVEVLNKYDHDQMWYIGAPSESVEQNVMHSFGMAFGGGGFALSWPAAAALKENMEEKGCLERYRSLYGSDQRVHACLLEIGVPLTLEPGFHQVDLRGDIYGMLVAHPVAPLVSLHHLNSVRPIFPHRAFQLSSLQALMAASKLDQLRTLQQSFCYIPSLNWSISVSWGYAVQLFPFSLHPRDLVLPLQTFKTWRTSKSGPFMFKTRLLPPQRSCQRPFVYFLDRVEKIGIGTKSVYAKKGTTNISWKACLDNAGFKTAMQVKTVKVSAPKLETHQWNKAPRRQCCEARRSWIGGSIDVRIRSCHSGEITSPP